MERAISSNERIRRAEEIYARRQNIRERTRRATVNVSDTPKNFRLLKKVVLQIIICVLIYFIFYLINTTNYTFSESALNKTRELVSKDINFMEIYNNIINTVNSYISTIETKKSGENNINAENIVEEQAENKNQIENVVNTNQENTNEVGNLSFVTDTGETTGQTEIKDVELSETDRIKQNYDFTLPLKGTVSSEFGTREATSSVMSTYHKGIDIAAVTGTKIVSATEGTVSIARYSSSYGNYIMIENEEVKTVYAHCSELLVSVRR